MENNGINNLTVYPSVKKHNRLKVVAFAAALGIAASLALKATDLSGNNHKPEITTSTVVEQPTSFNTLLQDKNGIIKSFASNGYDLSEDINTISGTIAANSNFNNVLPQLLDKVIFTSDDGKDYTFEEMDGAFIRAIDDQACDRAANNLSILANVYLKAIISSIVGVSTDDIKRLDFSSRSAHTFGIQDNSATVTLKNGEVYKVNFYDGKEASSFAINIDNALCRVYRTESEYSNLRLTYLSLIRFLYCSIATSRDGNTIFVSAEISPDLIEKNFPGKGYYEEEVNEYYTRKTPYTYGK